MAMACAEDIPNPDIYCQCYKKLSAMGIPLYITDESDYYTEGRYEIPFESAFTFPEWIRIDERVKEYPMVEDTHLSDVFREMSQVVLGLSDFEQNELNFWTLDMFIEGLWTAQKAGMNHVHQKATLLWIAYFFNFIQRANPTRVQLFRHLKEVLFPKDKCPGLEQASGETLMAQTISEMSSRRGEAEEVWALPLPPAWTGPEEDWEENTADERSQKSSGDHSENSFEGSHHSTTATNVSSMTTILEILYRIFGRSWMYLELRSAIHDKRVRESVELPFVLHTPKPKFKVETPVTAKGGKKSIPRDKSQHEMDSAKLLHKNDFILPLQASEEAKTVTAMLFGLASPDKKGKKSKN